MLDRLEFARNRPGILGWGTRFGVLGEYETANDDDQVEEKPRKVPTQESPAAHRHHGGLMVQTFEEGYNVRSPEWKRSTHSVPQVDEKLGQRREERIVPEGLPRLRLERLLQPEREDAGKEGARFSERPDPVFGMGSYVEQGLREGLEPAEEMIPVLRWLPGDWSDCSRRLRRAGDHGHEANQLLGLKPSFARTQVHTDFVLHETLELCDVVIGQVEKAREQVIKGVVHGYRGEG